MTTLAEVEAAAEKLPREQQQELLLFIARRLRAVGEALPEPRLFSDEKIKAWLDEDEEDMRRFRSGR